MSEKDAAKEKADRVGGWENLARGLHELHTTGKNTLLKEYFNRAELMRLSKLLFPITRGAKTKRDWKWFLEVEGIIQAKKAQNPWDTEKSIVDKNLEHFYGKLGRPSTKYREKANKTVRNALSTIRREMKKLSSTYDPSTDLGQKFLNEYEAPPDGHEYTD